MTKCTHGLHFSGCGACQDYAATATQPDPYSHALDTCMAWIPPIDPDVYAAYRRRVKAAVHDLARDATDAATLIEALGLEEAA